MDNLCAAYCEDPAHTELLPHSETRNMASRLRENVDLSRDYCGITLYAEGLER